VATRGQTPEDNHWGGREQRKNGNKDIVRMKIGVTRKKVKETQHRPKTAKGGGTCSTKIVHLLHKIEGQKSWGGRHNKPKKRGIGFRRRKKKRTENNNRKVRDPKVVVIGRKGKR